MVETLILLTVAIVGIAAGCRAADSLTEVAMALAARLGYSIRVAMYRSHLQKLSLSYHDKKRTGDVLTRVTGDVGVVEEFIIDSVKSPGAWLVLTGSLAVLFWQSWNVALVAVVVVPMLAFVSNFILPADQDCLQGPAHPGGQLAPTAQEMLDPRHPAVPSYAAARSTSSSSPARPTRACAPHCRPRTSRRSSASWSR